MLEQSEILMGFAGLAVTLIGFSGIVVVFGERNRRGWTADERQRLILLVMPSTAVFFGAILPIILAEAGVESTLNWRISNGVFGILHILNIGWFIVNPIKAKKTLGQNLNIVHGVVAIAGNLLAAAGFLPWLVAIYIFALVQQLWIGIYNYWLTLAPSMVANEERTE